MENNRGNYITGGEFIFYPNAIKRIRKSSDHLRPIYEAFTNSLESIRSLESDIENEYIEIKIFHQKCIFEDQEQYVFEKIQIEDSGVGFNEENFKRFKRLHDNTKGYNNLGSGRIQLVQFFSKSIYESVYSDIEGDLNKREFILSNSPIYQKENSIIYDKGFHRVEGERRTILTMCELLDEKDAKYYNELTCTLLKEKLLSHYVMLFCALQSLPKILLKHFVNGEEQEKEQLSINKSDIPQVDEEKPFSVFYSTLSNDGKEVIKTNQKEEFTLRTFKIDSKILDKNEIKFTSKEEIVEDSNLKLLDLSSNDSIYNKRYLFLLSGEYVNNRESDTRGVIEIPTAEQYKKEHNIFSQDEIILEDLEQEANFTISSLYPEIRKKQEDRQDKIEELKEIFLFNDEILAEVSKNILVNDSGDRILEKYFTAESKRTAKSASIIKKQIDDLKELDPTLDNYEEELTKRVNKLVKEIPLQSRAALTQYVARRQIVLELFNKVLIRQLDTQNEKNRKKDEALLHNIIFKQKSNSPDTSDLWLINEDFVLYTGSSEARIVDIEYNGEKIIKSDTELTAEQIEARDSLNLKRYSKRLDAILFPEEGKCVIIEFKSPEVSLGDHLTQIQNYATLIRNFSKDKYDFTTFYGYLIGEKANIFEIRNNDPNFREAQYFDYMYKPVSDVPGYWGKKDGVIYTEIIKYTTLLERARKRNEIFINKIKFWSSNDENNPE